LQHILAAALEVHKSVHGIDAVEQPSHCFEFLNSSDCAFIKDWLLNSSFTYILRAHTFWETFFLFSILRTPPKAELNAFTKSVFVIIYAHNIAH